MRILMLSLLLLKALPVMAEQPTAVVVVEQPVVERGNDAQIDAVDVLKGSEQAFDGASPERFERLNQGEDESIHRFEDASKNDVASAPIRVARLQDRDDNGFLHSPKPLAQLKVEGCEADIVSRLKWLQNATAGRQDLAQQYARQKFGAQNFFIHRDVNFESPERIFIFCKCCRDFGGRHVVYSSGKVQWRENAEFAAELSRTLEEEGLALRADEPLDDKTLRTASDLFTGLGADTFDERQAAFEALARIGWRAMPLAAKEADSRDPEVALRCKLLMERWKPDELYNRALYRELDTVRVAIPSIAK